jgi:3-oxoacyl-[acyl-carrier protein] reductase
METNINYNFDGQTAVITGGTRGIGQAISKAFLDAGATVIATYTSNDEAAQSFKGSLGAQGEKLVLRKFDVSNAEEVDAFWNWTGENHPETSILINNSGIRRDGLTASMPIEDWEKVMNVNLMGTFLMSQKSVLHFMKSRYGRIINMSSIGGSLGLAGQANYAASKAGQVALSKTLSKEVAKRGITVNNVCPGFIETELIQDLPEEQVKEYKKQVPMKRFGSSKEVADVVLFLASKEAAYITGTSVEISGGL